MVGLSTACGSKPWLIKIINQSNSLYFYHNMKRDTGTVDPFKTTHQLIDKRNHTWARVSDIVSLLYLQCKTFNTQISQ